MNRKMYLTNNTLISLEMSYPSFIQKLKDGTKLHRSQLKISFSCDIMANFSRFSREHEDLLHKSHEFHYHELNAALDTRIGVMSKGSTNQLAYIELESCSSTMEECIIGHEAICAIQYEIIEDTKSISMSDIFVDFDNKTMSKSIPEESLNDRRLTKIHNMGL